jgi:LysR family transcriptional regulator, low CO2-responsive transcriptional regulator
LPLYEQWWQALYLTEAGEALAETARAMVDEWAAFEQRIDAMKGLTARRLRLAVVSTAKYFVPRLLGSFCASAPGDRCRARSAQSRRRGAAAARQSRRPLHHVDAAGDIDLERHIFLPNPLVLIAPERTSLAGVARCP